MLIHGYTDEILIKLAELLHLEILEYKLSEDPTKIICDKSQEYVTYVPSVITEDCEIKKKYECI